MVICEGPYCGGTSTKAWRILRQVVLDIHFSTCAWCGEGIGVDAERWVAHHLDGDPTNNSIYNLVPMHLSCHNKYEGYAVLGWRGRAVWFDEDFQRMLDIQFMYPHKFSRREKRRFRRMLNRAKG